MDIISNYEKGRQAEQMALEFLKKNKLKLVDRNYRTNHGEIDLIMHDGNHLIFVEVRSRKRNSLVSPAETIDNNKRLRIIRASQRYLLENRKISWNSCRFDVVTITGNKKQNDIEWIKNAFDA